MVVGIIFFVFMMLSVWGFQLLCFKYKKNKKIYKRLLLIPYVEVAIGIVLCILMFTTEVYEMMFVLLFFLILPLIHACFYYCIPYWKEKLPWKVRRRFLVFVLGYLAILGVILLWVRNTQLH